MVKKLVDLVRTKIISSCINKDGIGYWRHQTSLLLHSLFHTLPHQLHATWRLQSTRFNNLVLLLFFNTLFRIIFFLCLTRVFQEYQSQCFCSPQSQCHSSARFWCFCSSPRQPSYVRPLNPLDRPTKLFITTICW